MGDLGVSGPTGKRGDQVNAYTLMTVQFLTLTDYRVPRRFFMLHFTFRGQTV